MLTSLEIHLQKEDDNLDISQHFGSLMHGVLMEKIDPRYADILHQNNLKPYSQYLYYDYAKKLYVWRINTLTEEAGEKIIHPLLKDSEDFLFIRQKKANLRIIGKEIVSVISYREMAEKYFLTDRIPRKTVIKFLTPATFKKDGQFVIFPDIVNIYKSLYNKWNSFYSYISLEDEQVLEHLINHTVMIGYKLRSTKFDMEKVRIKSFKGEICLLLQGPPSLSSIARILFAFGEFSGIGAKCSIGMGGINIE